VIMTNETYPFGEKLLISFKPIICKLNCSHVITSFSCLMCSCDQQMTPNGYVSKKKKNSLNIRDMVINLFF
jgi:hypothetical protein